MQSGNETWTVIRIRCENFFFKNHAENEAGRLVLGLFLLLKKVFIKENQEFSTLVLIHFDRTRLGHKIKTSF